ncbi:craniofacial development protein 2-like [Penaeus indicus]|uniref:craniofacial development protein 2-like n=1 Tax=Penaeus indicus TaxID=29960 RepID=UPI00300C6FFC
MLDKDRANSMIRFWAISERVLLVKLKGHPFNLSIIQVYAPTSEHTEEEVEAFYEEVEQAKKQCKSQDIVMIMGDLNAKVGKGREGDTVGPHGLGERNERGESWIEWCLENGQVIMNTWFQHHPRRLYTWISPGDSARNQIDYITINQRFRNAVMQVKGYPGADCASYHVLLICHLKIKLRKLKKSKITPKLEVSQISRNETLKQQFNVEVQNRYSVLENESETPDEWTIFRDAIVYGAESVIPKTKKKAKQKWMTDEILQLMDKRRAVKHENDKYKELNN